MIIIYPVNTTFPSPRANTIQILRTANELACLGNEVHLVAKRSSSTLQEIFDYYGIEPSPDLILHLVPAPRIFANTRAHESLILKRAIQVLTHFRRRSKIVFTRDPLFAGMLLRMRSLFGHKLVYEAHTVFSLTARETYMPVAWSEKKEKRLRRREEMVFGRADGIVYISNSLKELVEATFVPPVHSTVVHDGTSVPSRMPSAQKDPLSVCYCGQFYSWKGVNTLLEAMQWVSGGTLRLYGGGYSTVQDDLRVMERIIEKYRLSDRVRRCGFRPRFRVRWAGSECSIGVLPLPNNIIGNRCNSPLKLFDYLAAGLAVVSSDLLTVREILRHGDNGHLVPPGDPRALADGINLLLRDEAYRQAIARAGFQTVKNYSWKRRAAEINRFLNWTKLCG
jgi:glycosyltransferase involved in cell wall biosynthesis